MTVTTARHFNGDHSFHRPAAQPKRRVVLRSAAEVGAPSIPAQQRLVVECLIDAFGGEATASELHRHLSPTLGWQSVKAQPWLANLLNGLETSGAVSLEANGETEVIVRLLPAGAELAYGAAS